DDVVPEILTQPVSQSVEVDTMVSFTVETNEGNYTYQWQYANPETEEWENCFLNGYNTNMLNVKATSYRDGMKFRCLITKDNTIVTSEAAVLKLLK
ncbi:MAG: hypothetical protein IKA09_01360, partial [Lachnospiraceae bacterium]|nr:hypothetical protein [Lachnospiraceae bacterium]